MSRYKVYTSDNSVYNTDVLDWEPLGTEMMLMMVPKNGPTAGQKTFVSRQNVSLISETEEKVGEYVLPTEAPAYSLYLGDPEPILEMISKGETVPFEVWQSFLKDA